MIKSAAGVPPVSGDRQRIEQVVSNLVGNAIKHSPDGTPVEIEAAADGEYVRVAVIDHGSGIEPKFLARLFEPFTQAGSDSSRESGLGLGLYIVRGLVEAMGGTIEANSRLGEGSEFVLRLPRAPR